MIEGAVADLNQVFLDLLANSARAIEDTGRDDGRIEVTTEFGADDVVIEIKDNGCGISPESIPRFSIRFSRPSRQAREWGSVLASATASLPSTAAGSRFQATLVWAAAFELCCPASLSVTKRVRSLWRACTNRQAEIEGLRFGSFIVSLPFLHSEAVPIDWN